LAILLLTVSAGPALAGDGHNQVSVQDNTVRNDEQHETAFAFDVSDANNETGRVLDPIEGEAAAVNLAVLPGGDLLYYSGVEADPSEDEPTDLHFIWNATPFQGKSRVMDLTLGTGERGASVATPTPSDGGYFDLFCSATTITPDGTAVAPGATDYYTLDDEPPENLYTPLKGYEQTMLFENDDVSDEGQDWQRGPDMDADRWYPSALQLPNGETLVASGIQSLFYPNTYTTLVETFDPADASTGWANVDTSIEVTENASAPQRVLPDAPNTGVAVVDETHRGVPNLPMYPRLHVVPGGPNAGEVLYGANGDVWGPFGEHPSQPLMGYFQTLEPYQSFSTNEASWEVHASSPFGLRNLGAMVPMMVDVSDPQPRYLSFGGTLQQSSVATATAEIVDASEQTVKSTPTDPLNIPRWSVNGVLLPDGSVLAVGGSTYDNVLAHGSPSAAPLNLERFVPDDSATGGQWELMKPTEKIRAYHSSAVLLPDGRVAIGGHVPLPAFHDAQRNELGNPQPNDTSFEIYEPPYLFHEDETRPEITPTQLGAENSASAGDTPAIDAEPGQTIDVPVENLGDGDASLDSVTLMRPGSATHQYNADQLGLELDATLDERGDQTFVDVTFPDELAMAPGHYMLFANEDANGDKAGGFFPSEAAWVEFGDVEGTDGGYDYGG